MDNKEIEQLKIRLGEVGKENRNQQQTDNMLATLGDNPGWGVLKSRLEGRINVLLEPGVETIQSLEMLGAVTMARELAISELRRVIAEVETTKAALKKETK